MPTPSTTTPKSKKTITKEKTKKRRRTKIEKQIKFYQEQNKHLIPVSCMRRLVQEILRENGNGLRITKAAQEMIQTEAENTMVSKLRKANHLANYCNRDTVTAADLRNIGLLEYKQ